MIQFGKNVFLRFRKIKDIFQIDEEIGKSHYGLDGDSGLFCTNLFFDKALIILKGIIINVNSPEFLPNVDFIFKKIVEEKKYKHEKNMSINPIQTSLNPFAMFDVNPEILKELDFNLVEFIEYDTILVESPQKDFSEKMILNIEILDVGHILARFGYTLKKSIPLTAANSLSSEIKAKVKAFEKALVSEGNEKALKEILSDVFGLVENLDYVKEVKKDDYISEQVDSIKQIAEMRKQEDYSITDNWDKKPIQLKILLANQVKYMKTLPKHLMTSLGKLVALDYDRKTDCCEPKEILDIIEDRYCKFVKQIKKYENSWFDEKTGLRIKVAKTSDSFGQLKASFQDIQFLNVQNPECIKDFDTIGVLVPVCLSVEREKIGIFGTTFNGDDLI